MEAITFSNVPGVNVTTGLTEEGNVFVSIKPEGKNRRSLIFSQHTWFDLILFYFANYDVDKIKKLKEELPDKYELEFIVKYKKV